VVRFHLTGDVFYGPYIRSFLLWYVRFYLFSQSTRVLFYDVWDDPSIHPSTHPSSRPDHASASRNARSIAAYTGNARLTKNGSTTRATYRSYTPVATLTTYAPYKNPNTVIALTRNPAIGCASNHRSILVE
jgi:hypothetical protein